MKQVTEMQTLGWAAEVRDKIKANAVVLFVKFCRFGQSQTSTKKRGHKILKE